MANELQAILPPLLQAINPNGGRHISLGIDNFVAGNKINELHLHMQSPDTTPPLLTPDGANRDFNRQYYNLFVGGELDIEHSSPFKIDTDRALEHTRDELRVKYSALSDAKIVRELQTLPCIFANENNHYGYADEDQTAGFGYIRQIKPRRKQIQIFPKVIYRLPQQRLNEALFELDLNGSSSFNEFNRSHWSIKQVDLIAELIEMGFEL